MKSVTITGHKTTIAINFKKLLKDNFNINDINTTHIDEYLYSDWYFFCHGIQMPFTDIQKTSDQLMESYYKNYLTHFQCIEKIVEHNDTAKICVIGSESAYFGSHDQSYANNKLLLHNYVENKKLRTDRQQLFCISPGMIVDSGMTYRRKDKENIVKRVNSHPMKRLLTSKEVAKLAYYILSEQSYISSVVLRINGGQKNV